ncbi:MAG: hypothetical protein H0W08_00210 [Acidobacteria bacterium]|nr:hypothetical protein [Acidobacteriota bacterium]
MRHWGVTKGKKVGVLGLGGQSSDVALTLYLRRAHRLRNPDPGRVTIVEGDVLDPDPLRTTMQGQDVRCRLGVSHG